MKSVGLLTTAGLAIAWAMPASAQELSYHLPHGTALGGYKWQLQKCPSAVDPEVLISHGASIAGTYGRGTLVRLNPRSPFLGSRKVALTYHEDGTLKAINAEGEGKGGAVIASFLKTAAGFAGIALPNAIEGAPPPILTGGCKPKVAETVDRWRYISDRIEQTEDRIGAGAVLTGVAKSLYESDLKEKAALAKALTITVASKGLEALPKRLANGDYSAVQAISKPDFSAWFGGDTSDMIKAPIHVCARYSVAKADIDAATPVKGSGEAPSGSKLQNRFYYYRPVPVLVEILQDVPDSQGKLVCNALPAKPEVLGKGTVMVPQLSGHYFTLPIGSGAFESKAIAAEFTPEGRLVSMSYSNTGAGAGINEALAGGLSAAQTLRDSDVAATKREIDRIKAENELEALREAAEAAP